MAFVSFRYGHLSPLKIFGSTVYRNDSIFSFVLKQNDFRYNVIWKKKLPRIENCLRVVTVFCWTRFFTYYIMTTKSSRGCLFFRFRCYNLSCLVFLFCFNLNFVSFIFCREFNLCKIRFGFAVEIFSVVREWVLVQILVHHSC